MQPAQLVPPHWAHLAAVQAPEVPVAAAEEVVLVVGALEVVDAAEVVLDVAALDGTAEDEPPPDEAVKDFLAFKCGPHVLDESILSYSPPDPIVVVRLPDSTYTPEK